MCLATPVKINRIEDDFAFVKSDGKEFKVTLKLLKNAKVGDWILTHGDLAISSLPQDEAYTILDLIRKSGCHCE